MDDNHSSTSSSFERRELLAILAFGGAAGGAIFPTQAFATPTPDAPAVHGTQAVELFAKLVGDTSGKVTLGYSEGAVWGFRPQADDLALADFARRIYGYKSLTARKVRRLDNGDFAIRQQGWTFYADPITEAITDTLHNPYTGVDVEPYSPPSVAWEIAYRPDGTSYIPGREDTNPLGNGQSTDFDTPFDMRVRTIGAHSFITTAQFIRFRPANIDWWKLEATLFSYACNTADLTNPDLTHIPSTSSMNLVAEWQTWMNMHGSPGHILFKGEGASIASIDEAPADFRSALASRYAGQLDAALGW